MCGICGIVSLTGRDVEETSIRCMMEKMKHRGPDDQGLFIDQNVGLGFVRLSILDLTSAGHQPMFSSRKDLVVVFNGEIYNFIELREELESAGYTFFTKTDTEVLLAAYQEWGADCLNRFNGMWAFAILDRSKKTLFIARDRFGVKPFYYYIDNELLVFASEIQPILKVLKSRPEPDYQSIYDYLVYNRTDQTEATFFSRIKKLQHGNLVRLELNQTPHEFKPYRWYNLRTNLKEPFTSKDEFREYFISSLKLRLRSDVPVGVCLSGGLDSSSITSVLLTEFAKNDLNTFSAVYPFHDDESEFLNEYKEIITNMHFISPDADSLYEDITDFVRAHGEPVPSTGPYAQFKVMELARKRVVVTLDGQGADELLAGYHYFFGFYFRELLSDFRAGKLLRETYYYYKKHGSLYGIYTLLFFLFPAGVKDRLRVKNRGYLQKSFIGRYSKSNNIADELYSSKTLNDALIDHFEYKLEHLLKWEDRNSMNFSIEARIPFLDYRLVERTLSLPSGQIIRNGITKYILRESMQGILPEKIRTRNDKIGFDTPQADWFRSDRFRIYITELLSSRSFESRNIVNVNMAKKLFNDHLKGKIDISKDIWKWINLELWFRLFID